MTTTREDRTAQPWTVRTVRHPHGRASRLWVSPDRTQYKVFETGRPHPMNRLVPVEDTPRDGGPS